MSDNEDSTAEKPFFVDVAKQSRAACKKCKDKCMSGEVRIAKLAANPYGAGKMKSWHHVECIFELFLKQRPTTKRIETVDDMDGFDDIDVENQQKIIKFIEESEKNIRQKYSLTTSPKKIVTRTPKAKISEKSPVKTSKSDIKTNESHKDNSFREFRKLVTDITNVSSYLDKTALVSKMFTKGTDGVSFKGDIKLWCRLLLPGVVKRIYNVKSKQLIKLFSKIFGTNQSDMMEHLEQGDVSETIVYFLKESQICKEASKSILTLKEVDNFLQELSNLTKEDEQIEHFQSILPKCTANDLRVLIRLIKHDLRMYAGAKHILDGVHPDAYEAHQASRDIDSVIDRCLGNSSSGKIAKISLLTPVLPMLAEACKSVDQAMSKCPNGMYSEIKYDGERVQIHKQGGEFKYYSRGLKPVAAHKVVQLKHYIPKAFPNGTDLILDSEILMIDIHTGKPLPFGSLGIHKKLEFKDANVCLFVFDCIYYNGKDLTGKPLEYRKQILKDNMTEIPNHILFSEMEEIYSSSDLRNMIAKVLKLGLEGLVLKDIKSTYEPGKRHWLKVKKDYLFDGAMADSADLIVLGAWYGTGKKGGMMSVFLMGCYDPKRDRFCTVTKVHTGHDDKTLEKLQTELDMVKIRDSNNQIPDWLHCTKTMIPDFVAKDPRKQPVWEITGAEITKHDVHTANGISIRFPRVTKIRDDKSWDHATNLKELEVLFEKSKTTDVSLLIKGNKNETRLKQTLFETKPKIIETKRKSIENKNSPPKRKLSTSSLTPPKKKPSTSNETPSSSSSFSEKQSTDTIVSNLFKDVRLLCNEDCFLVFDDTIKTFAHHGGTVLTNEQWETATHVLHVRDTEDSYESFQAPVNARHIIIEWIKDSLDQNSLRDILPYSVRLTGQNVPRGFFS